MKKICTRVSFGLAAPMLSRRVVVGGRLLLLTLSLIALFGGVANAQVPYEEALQNRKVRFATVLDGDTIPLYYLNEVDVTGSMLMLTPQEIRKNRKLIRNVKLMLPFAREGKRRLDQLEVQIAQMPKKERKAAIKKAEKDLLDEYGKDLKKYTFSQGLVLIKLIDRETGRTTYRVVDELRGRLRATFYQMFARLFGYNLKTAFDPAHNKTDDLIDRIVISIDHGKL